MRQIHKQNRAPPEQPDKAVFGKDICIIPKIFAVIFTRPESLLPFIIFCLGQSVAFALPSALPRSIKCLQHMFPQGFTSKK